MKKFFGFSNFQKKYPGLLVFIFFFILPVFAQNLWRGQNPYSSSESLRVGDVVTVFFNENQKLTYHFELTRDDQFTIKSFPDKDITKFLPKVESSKSVNRKKKGELNGGNRFRGSMSVLVLSGNNDGTYRVGGTKIYTFDGESTSLQLTGIIHPRDINATYGISSEKVANLVINFQGQIVKKRRKLQNLGESQPGEGENRQSKITVSPDINTEDQRAILKSYLEEIIGEIMDQDSRP